MKHLAKLLFVAALIFTSGLAMANGNLKVSIVQEEANEAIVKISNAVNSVYEIEVKNASGNILYYKQTQRPSKTYSSVYDLTGLYDGKYTFTVNVANETSTSMVNVTNGKVEVIDYNKELDPYFALNNNYLKISYLNFNKSDIVLYVYDDSSKRMLYEEDLGTEFAMNHAVNLSKLKSGSYSAMLVSNQGTHEYDIYID
ncbi:hypothetical protein [Maribellus mangrovi]|uniref:hypothetical protein n=1 Tax=Maribellus mangrovi TaxID=3133146 RepID=UPI0030EC37C6